MEKPENTGLKLRSPAKVNLFLRVVGKRPDGYHDLITLMCPITLTDTVYLSFETQKITVTCSDPQIPQDETNIAHKAAVCFFERYSSERRKGSVRRQGVAIHIDKRIPSSAGLGGGSSNAAAVLMGLNEHYGHPMSTEQLLSMGLTIGADVPFFIRGKPAIARGIGEKLENYPGLIPYHVVLVFPGFGVATSMVYADLNLALTNCKKTITNSLLKQREFHADRHLCNDLESVTASKYPVVNSIKKSLLDHGATGALMSGSGPTVFGLFSNPAKAGNAFDTLSRSRKWRVFLADMLT